MRLEGDRVLGPRGDVLAEKVYGQWQTKDPAVLEFIQSSAEKVRARNDKGHYVKDDPTTPENEAWTTKVKKAVKRKK